MTNLFTLGIAYQEPGHKFPLLYESSIIAESFSEAKKEFLKNPNVEEHGIGEVFVSKLGGFIQ